MPNLRARWLRKNMTPQEVKLWVQLRYLKFQGFHFRRQVPIGPYIVDFAAKAVRLVLEVDGSQHGYEQGQMRDAKRDHFLATQGYRVLRFWNTEVDTNMDGVIDAIIADLDRRTACQPAPPLPSLNPAPISSAATSAQTRPKPTTC